MPRDLDISTGRDLGIDVSQPVDPAGTNPSTPTSPKRDWKDALEAVTRTVAGTVVPGWHPLEAAFAAATPFLGGDQSGNFAARYLHNLKNIDQNTYGFQRDNPKVSGAIQGLTALPAAMLTAGGSLAPKLAVTATGEALPRSALIAERARQGLGAGALYAGANSRAGETNDAGQYVKDMLTGGVLGAGLGGAAGAVEPTNAGALQTAANLERTANLENKVAEKGLQIATGSKNMGKRAAKVLAKEDAARPVQAGLEVFRSGDLASGFKEPDQLANSLAAAQNQAGQDVGNFYAPLQQSMIPLARVEEVIRAPVAAIDRAATRESAGDAGKYLTEAIKDARRAAMARNLQADPFRTGDTAAVSPADLHALRMDMDTRARGWTGTANPRDNAAGSAINVGRGKLNAEVLLPELDRLGLGEQGRTLDARFSRLADAAGLAEANRTGGLYGAEDAVAQMERMLHPAGSLTARVGHGVGGNIGEVLGGGSSMFQKYVANNPRWLQYRGRSLYGDLQDAYATPGGVGVRSFGPSGIQAFIEALRQRAGSPALVPAGADQESSK